MQFIHETNASQAAAALAERLVAELKADKRVAWFVSGGSNTTLAAQIMAAIPEDLSSKLTVLLLDERFGIPGHPDSNWQQLLDAGFDPKKAHVIPTLQAEKTLEITCSDYGKTVHQVVENSDIVIAQCGIGGDGHIAGILPHSAALTDSDWVRGYDGGTYKRITITPPVWKHIDLAYAFAYGDTKLAALRRLKEETLSVSDQPAQLLKEVPEAYVYTDQQLDQPV